MLSRALSIGTFSNISAMIMNGLYKNLLCITEERHIFALHLNINLPKKKQKKRKSNIYVFIHGKVTKKIRK